MLNDTGDDFTQTETSVTVRRHMLATAEEIFAILRDPSLHSVIDGSGTVRQSKGAKTLLELGSKFSMSMKMGVPYAITNTVVEFEENRKIAWKHFGGHIWRYELEAAGDGTMVYETFDWSDAKAAPIYLALKLPTRHLGAMRRTLERLDALVTNRRQPV